MILTADASPAPEQRALNTGGRLVLTTPFSRDVIVTQLCAMLADTKGAGQTVNDIPVNSARR